MRYCLAGAYLTAKEYVVVQYVSEGRTNKEIASVLGIEETTVKGHVAKIMRATKSQNRVILAVKYTEEIKVR